MARRLKITILGSGSSTGVPRIGNRWSECDPNEPRNRRLRSSILIEAGEPGAEQTTILIDTSPDLRQQLLNSGTMHLDAVFFTHDHADQTHGIDDLRQVIDMMGRQIPAYMDDFTAGRLVDRFTYCFKESKSGYKPLCLLNILKPHEPVTIDGPGGPVTLVAGELDHGFIRSLGYVIEGRIGYSPDVVKIPDEAFELFKGLECWICDALQWKPHFTHSWVDNTLEWFARAGTHQGILTNLSGRIDYRKAKEYVPPHVDVAYDGMVLEFEV